MDDRGQGYNSLRGASRGVQENWGANTRFPNLGESPCQKQNDGSEVPRNPRERVAHCSRRRNLGSGLAGECLGVSSSIDTVIPITLIHVKMEEGSVLIQEIAPDLNAMIYVFGGRVKLEDPLSVRNHPLPFGLGVKQFVSDGELGLLSQGGEIEIKSESESEFLILAGPEINEPIARYGPFVMNTREEINQAFLDYQNGTLAN